MSEKKIKAVIFDMDGVLIDAREWHYESLNKALALFGYEINRYEHVVTYDGLPTSKKLEMLSRERGLPVKLHPFINKLKQQYTFERVMIDCHPVFAHEYALASLKQQGYKIAVASNSVRNTVDLMMERSHLSEYLDFTLCNQDVTKPKPNPEIYLTAVSKLEFLPEECLVVEDNKNGIAAAIASGCHVMKVKDVNDVYFDNIVQHIVSAERGQM